MVAGDTLINRVMETYKLIDLSASDSENEIIHFAPFESTSTHPPRKKRLKRKERDLLRYPQASSSSYGGSSSKFCGCCCPSPSSSTGYLVELNPNFCGLGIPPLPRGWEACKSTLLLIVIFTLSFLTWFSIHLHSRLDATQRLFTKVEASGSELPSKFHESHVRLQQLELNHTALWETVSRMVEAEKEVQKKLSTVESIVRRVETSFSASPELSSLPKDVVTLQQSVASFGSSLKDVQSSIKVFGEKEVELEEKINKDGEALHKLQEYILSLKNLSVSLGSGREGVAMSLPQVLQSVRFDVDKVSEQFSNLNQSLEQVNRTLTEELSHKNQTEKQFKNVESSLSGSLLNVSLRLSALEAQDERGESSFEIAKNLTKDVDAVKEKVDRQYRRIEDLVENVAVVKGVERKLEGSQVQMASGVSELKQQIQKLESAVVELRPSERSTEKPAKIQSLTRKAREIVEEENQDLFGSMEDRLRRQ